MSLTIQPERDDTSIVLVGSLNPAIYQPLWFANHDLIGKEQAEEAEFGIVSGEITQFRASNIKFQVEKNRFIVSCETAHRLRLKDLVIECFGELLPHTPIHMVGLNRELHFSCGTVDNRTKFGRRLAPREPWGEWGQLIDKNAVEHPGKAGGLNTLQMRNSPRSDGHTGYTQVEVQGSALVRDNSGVFIRLNDHFEITDEGESAKAAAAVAIIDEMWEASMATGEAIIDQLMRESIKP